MQIADRNDTFKENFPSISAMYHLLQFSDGTVVASDNWIKRDDKVCSLPPPSAVTKKLVEKASPDSNWDKFVYDEILLSSGKYTQNSLPITHVQLYIGKITIL